MEVQNHEIILLLLNLNLVILDTANSHKSTYSIVATTIIETQGRYKRPSFDNNYRTGIMKKIELFDCLAFVDLHISHDYTSQLKKYQLTNSMKVLITLIITGGH